MSDSTSVLVLGGGAFVGRAVVADALARGWSVTVCNRGRTGDVDPRAARLLADRLDPASLAVLGEGRWDVVVDTWSGAPSATEHVTRVLAPVAGRYAYVSSASVYRDPLLPGTREDGPVVAADPSAPARDYAADKRGSELAVLDAFGDRSVLLRSCLVLGPHEDVGRLPWWLQRMARGGEVLAPGPEDLPIQFIDARDLAAFALDAAVDGRSGPVNVSSRPGERNMRELLDACRRSAGAPGTSLTWVPPDAIVAWGLAPWTELPVWIPPGHEAEGIHQVDVELAHSWGLRSRPTDETVADTWAWLAALDGAPPARDGLPVHGVDPDVERRVLADWHASI